MDLPVLHGKKQVGTGAVEKIREERTIARNIVVQIGFCAEISQSKLLGECIVQAESDVPRERLVYLLMELRPPDVLERSDDKAGAAWTIEVILLAAPSPGFQALDRGRALPLRVSPCDRGTR